MIYRRCNKISANKQTGPFENSYNWVKAYVQLPLSLIFVRVLVSKTFKTISISEIEFYVQSHPFRPVKLASYFMQMRFEDSDIKFLLATSLFYNFIPEVASQHIHIDCPREKRPETFRLGAKESVVRLCSGG